MSQSPDKFIELRPDDSYLKNFDALSAMINRGRSFSGRERNCCFLNTGDDRFSDVSAATGLDFIDDGRAMAAVDWDHDGDLDLWTTNRTAPRLRLIRNEVQSNNRYLTVRLTGQSCNRDAIGARVELYLDGNESRMVAKTLHAGEGFMSQSSKWLHFGLGSSDRVQRMVVRWPGNKEGESFLGLQVNRRYTVVQGSGKAVAAEVAPRAVALRPSFSQVPQPTEAARLVLTRRLALAELAYVDFSGQPQILHPPAARAVLINVWASWCAPCLRELSDLATHARELRERGLDVVALSTDGLLDGTTGSVAAAEAFLSQIKWPFAAGVASKSAVRALTVLHNDVVYRERPLTLPTSFLVDGQGEIAVIYRGTVSVEQLMNDLELLDASTEQIAAAAFPFAGKIATRLFPRDATALARAYLEGGHIDDARRELLNYINENSNKAAEEDPLNAGKIRQKLAEAYHFLATLEKQRGRLDDAVHAMRQVVKLDPNQPVPRISLAVALWELGDRAGARQLLEQVLEMGPENATILNLLGQTHVQFGETERAIEYLRSALYREPETFSIRFNLGAALQAQGDAEQAIRHYRVVINQQPKMLQATNNLAWILATHSDEKIRSEAEALRLARKGINVAGAGQPSALDTLAAAQAASGDFDEATQTAEKALQLARVRGQTALADKIQERLQLYRQSQPFRQPPMK